MPNIEAVFKPKHKKGCSGVASVRSGSRQDPFDWTSPKHQPDDIEYHCTDLACPARVNVQYGADVNKVHDAAATDSALEEED